jgi:hypothetical protein
LIDFDDSVEAEVDFLSRHLADTETLHSKTGAGCPDHPTTDEYS